MKRIINGKRFNTETASEIVGWDNDYFHNDFKFCQESLYRTPKGVFFLHGKGGALSKYSQSCGNASTGGENIIPMTEDEVKEWLESTKNYNTMEELFNGDIEDA